MVEGLKKPNTLRKYKAVLNRFLDFFSQKTTARSITPDELNQFMVFLKKKHELGNNSAIHNIIIVAQFLKKQGRAGLTEESGASRSRIRAQADHDSGVIPIRIPGKPIKIPAASRSGFRSRPEPGWA